MNSWHAARSEVRSPARNGNGDTVLARRRLFAVWASVILVASSSRVVDHRTNALAFVESSPGVIVAVPAATDGRMGVEEDTWFPEYFRGGDPGSSARTPHVDDLSLSVGVTDLPPFHSSIAMVLPDLSQLSALDVNEIKLRMVAKLCQREIGNVPLDFSVRPIIAQWDVRTYTGEDALEVGEPLDSLRIFGTDDKLYWDPGWIEFNITRAAPYIEQEIFHGVVIVANDTYLRNAGCKVWSTERESPPEVIVDANTASLALPLLWRGSP